MVDSPPSTAMLHWIWRIERKSLKPVGMGNFKVAAVRPAWDKTH